MTQGRQTRKERGGVRTAGMLVMKFKTNPFYETRPFAIHHKVSEDQGTTKVRFGNLLTRKTNGTFTTSVVSTTECKK